ncbi:D-lactate dehydrogenase [Nakamurella sp. UYEF19]|uniref:FAD-binding and (Fe-S)-binding domain-containing protein n=1 Tax=Nakamurella sp. UYEF19 TaxID=1756392 RepID=UPI003393FDE9
MSLRSDPLPENVLAALRQAMPGDGAVRTRAIDRLSMAHDASHFLLTPSAVAVPQNAAEIGALFAVATMHGQSLTFRSGGTSLSGQGVTQGLLVDTRRHFRDIEVLDGGARVRVSPGATVRQVNARLTPYGRKLGPDPASESACTLGGVVANNSSGMACGTLDNAYRTVESMVVVLPGGTVLDTADADADQQLRHREPVLHQGLSDLRDRLRGNPASVAHITAQFAMKNTLGYGLNSFLDHSLPSDILAHLMVGSEGTLGFVASIVLRTVPVKPFTRTGLLVFDGLDAATGSLPELVASGAATIELLDAVSLRVGQRDPQADVSLRRIDVRSQAALLVEYQAESAAELADSTSSVPGLLSNMPLSEPADLTSDPAVQASLWHVRKGLYATVAGARPSGSTALLEDIAVPVPALLPTCRGLTDLFERHGYADSVIFGHAKDGNIHFMLTEQLGSPDAEGETAAPARLLAFTEDMVDLVLEHGGSLKAEHGTGRMMASYVRRQYGDELYDVMKTVKALFDPALILSPGVVITDDELAHVRHLKSAATVEQEVDRCVECGFCEPVCPSRDLTLTPRQRIVVRRELALAGQAGDGALVAELEKDYEYSGVDTCAVDGMCQTACPVLINTGDLVRTLRSQHHGTVARAGWTAAARHWDGVTRSASLALTVAKKVPAVAAAITAAGRRIADEDVLPLWSADLPAGGRRRHVATGSASDQAAVVYFSACVGTMFGAAGEPSGKSGSGVAQAFAELCARAGIVMAVPAEAAGLCCGTPWKSKGLTDGYHLMREKVLRSLWEASRNGELPIVCDASSCTEGLVQLAEQAAQAYPGLHVIDVVEFVRTTVLPRLPILRRARSMALHPTCSSRQLGLDPALWEVAAAVAREVDVPAAWGCCAFAGDRGLLHPELTAAATAQEAAEVLGSDHDAFASCNRTCELGMTRATGRQYRHLIELVAWATRPAG